MDRPDDKTFFSLVFSSSKADGTFPVREVVQQAEITQITVVPIPQRSKLLGKCTRFLVFDKKKVAEIVLLISIFFTFKTFFFYLT